MKTTFDITEDEVPIFQAETDEQFQILDDGLVRLENGERAEELIQALFRAAHTLKGAAGMIGHKRMVDLTHALETVLDILRKDKLEVTPELIDCCLEAVDDLRLLRDEVFGEQPAVLALDELVSRLSTLSAPAAAPCSPEPAAPASAPTNGKSARKPARKKASPAPDTLPVRAWIAADSIAPAARAFQLMLVLQECGQIYSMSPSQAEIEAFAPVREFRAEIIPNRPAEEIRSILGSISEVENIVVGAENGHREAQPAAIAAPAPVQETAAVPAAPAAGSSPADPQRSHAVEKTIRTSVERLDTLMDLVGELITDRNRLYLLRSNLTSTYHGDSSVDALSEAVTHIGRITDQLQAEVMGIRMLPISNVFNKFPRLVRDLARRANKQINLVIRGEDTELDRSVIEVINDPLIHTLRNAVDHGIEPTEARLAAGKPAAGTVLLTARHEQGRILITIEDDGGGIDTERVKAKALEKGLISEKDAAAMTPEEAVDLIFASGLSTARQITDISGRGVGLDIVRNNIERLNGTISIETWPGKGTQFLITLPLTLAIVPTLLVKVVNGTFAIPLVTVTETLRVRSSDIQTIYGRPVIQLRNHVLPVIRLADVFNIKAPENGSAPKGRRDHSYVVVVQAGKSQAGLIVDKLIGEQEVVVKSLNSVIGEVVGISSAAILGDGQVALILDILGILKIAAPH